MIKKSAANEKKVLIDASCIKCEQETLQTATYAGSYLKRLQCEECGNILETNKKELVKVYLDDFMDRFLLLPYELKKEWDRDGSINFIHDAPVKGINMFKKEMCGLSNLLMG